MKRPSHTPTGVAPDTRHASRRPSVAGHASGSPVRRAVTVNDLCWDRVRAFMLDRCGVALEPDQRYLLEPRLGPVARRHGFASLAEFVAHAVAPDAPESVASDVVEALTTHETSFFRDQNWWSHLRGVVLPSLSAVQGEVRVWCAACSTGQEVYSLLIALADGWPGLLSRTRLIATDVSTRSVERAREGVYSAAETSRGLDERNLLHFRARGADRQVSAALREHVTWGTHNLLAPQVPVVGCHLILCRNVLIYFSDATRREVIQRMTRALRPDGRLGVGSTELLQLRQEGAGWYTP